MIERKFADGTYKFNLGWDEALEWERVHGRSLYDAAVKMTQDIWLITDVAEVVRLGLIGGGTAAVDAAGLVEFYVKKRPLAESMKLAVDILEYTFWGIDREGVFAALGVNAEEVLTQEDGYGNVVPVTE